MKYNRAFFTQSTVFLLSLVTISCHVLKSPNSDDQQYWRDYSEKYLKKILKSQGIKGVDVAKNVIFFVGDGMSFATIAAGRILKGQMNQKSGEETEMVFESFPHLGMAKTYNIDKQVPDSAGTATALFTGIKTNLGVICLNPVTRNSKPTDRLKTIIDWAQAANKRTGIVTTTRITHATPAATYSYAETRNYECDTSVPEEKRSTYKDIARQLIEDKPGRNLNVKFGGGRDFLGASIEEGSKVEFKGSAEISCKRTDQENLAKKFLSLYDPEMNVSYVKNAGEMKALNYDDVDQVLGLFANNHMSYESLRDKESEEGEPSLTEMTKTAIRILNNKKNRHGFLLMVEGGKIDQAHHQNHARLAIEEMVEFEHAIKEVVDMDLEDTLIIVTADHAHSMVFNGYPSRGKDIFGILSKRNVEPYETLVYATGPGYWMHATNNTNNSFVPLDSFSTEQRAEPTYMHRSLIAMEDSVHSGEDVGVFATGPGSQLIQGVFEQSYIPYVISFASCIGPVSHKNPSCKNLKPRSEGHSLRFNLILLLTLNWFCISFNHVLS